MVRFHTPGDWPPGHVTICRVPDGRRRVPAVEAAIDAAWSAAAARPGVHLFDGPMCRLERWHATPDRLHLDLSPTSYKPFLGTNMANPALADRFGRDVMANPVGVSPALVTSDGYLMLGRRNGSVAYYPNRVHCFAGALEPDDADVFVAVRRELAEELSLTDAEVTDVRCTGVAEDLALRQPELIFAATTTLARVQVEARLDPEEHSGTWSVPAVPAGVNLAILDASQAGHASPADRLTPVALAALLLWGRCSFGNEWFADAAHPLHPPSLR